LYDTAANVFKAYGMLINRRLNSLICLQCKAVVLPQNVKPHLAKLHPGHKVQVNEQLVMDTATAEGILNTWPKLPSKGIPVQYAGLPCKVGVRCVACRTMYSKFKTMQKHARLAHGIIVDPKAPRRYSLMQHFANFPGVKSWFPVYGHSTLPTSSTPSAQYLSDLRKRLDEHSALLAGQVDYRQMSPWHTTTGWYSWLADKQPQDIFPYSDHPKAAQEQWTTVIDWVHCFFDYAYHLPSASSELALQILNTEAGNSEFNHTPFGPHQMGDTQQAYRQLFTQFIIFLIRIADSTSNYDLKLPVDVQEALQEFQQLALTPTASYQASGVQEFICNILIALWTKTYPPVGRTLFNDPTIRFIMHTQVKPDLSLKDPHQVTGILAKMTYCMRLAFLAYAHQQFDPETPENTLATEVRSLQPWFTVGQESTFHTIRSLQHRASALVMSSQNEPNMAWKDGSDYTVMIFKGGQVSLPNLISCQAALEDRSIHILLHDLLFDHNFSIDISRLRDDMGNSDPDYSLFTDRVNRPVLGPVDRLAQHILDTPALCERFVLAIENGEVIWNAVNLSIWLSTYTQFNLLCLVQVEMNCGAPGRTTELTAMPRVNTRTGMLRAL
ncbi:hypothetical protein L227DRAFT_477938, partial [Lentinus tigrinus ALCF2SS1-6]